MLSINRNQLKYLVIICMLLDHIAWAFVPRGTVLGQLMHFAGRLTGPTMAFFIAEGYEHTRDVRKYATRLGIFAVISWIPYSLFEYNTWPTPYFGVIYTLFLGLITLWLWDKGRCATWIKVVATIILCVLSLYGDWMILDTLLPLFLYQYRKDIKKRTIIFYLFAVASLIFCWYGRKPFWTGIYNFGIFLSPLIICHFYNHQSGSKNAFHKWFFYIFYPLHLFLLFLLKNMIY